MKPKSLEKMGQFRKAFTSRTIFLIMKKYIAEFIWTFWLVLWGCWTAVLAWADVGFIGVSLAFGLTVLTWAYALGHISWAHFNPAVSIGLWSAWKFDWKELVPYIISQLLWALFAAFILYFIVTWKDWWVIGSFAANWYWQLSPRWYGMRAAILSELVLTFIFLIVILWATSKRANPAFAWLSIWLTLTLIHLISIPVTNTSVNPARSISQAIFVWWEAINQLWLFILIPIVWAILAWIFYKFLLCCKCSWCCQAQEEVEVIENDDEEIIIKKEVKISQNKKKK